MCTINCRNRGDSMKKQTDTKKLLRQKEEAYEIELEQLNRMAEEALTAGRPLGKDMELLEQSRKADYMMLDIQQLREMLKEAEAAEKVTTEQPTDRNT